MGEAKKLKKLKKGAAVDQTQETATTAPLLMP
jgi:hypothetical protein